ncbi:hypothetical protein Adu01nite_29580 [Paractinoplanes durhamensis]|uniref:Uncharacterized protein n=1 Tax=Paractinoplanes durhamensis TaxID=113563 RepID=A0ABQ3YVJ4_9ACTN|nr:hypothetical protein Adu01nite_29580 [Actinoplanes durhamensis]
MDPRSWIPGRHHVSRNCSHGFGRTSRRSGGYSKIDWGRAGPGRAGPEPGRAGPEPGRPGAGAIDFAEVGASPRRPAAEIQGNGLSSRAQGPDIKKIETLTRAQTP